MVRINGRDATEVIEAAVDHISNNEEQENSMSNEKLEAVLQKLDLIHNKLSAIEGRLSKLDNEEPEEPEAEAELSEADGAAILYLLNGSTNEEHEYDEGANELLGRNYG